MQPILIIIIIIIIPCAPVIVRPVAIELNHACRCVVNLGKPTSLLRASNFQPRAGHKYLRVANISEKVGP